MKKYIALVLSFICSGLWIDLVKNKAEALDIVYTVAKAASITVAGTGTCFSADSPSLIVDCSNHVVGIGGATDSNAILTVGSSTAVDLVLQLIASAQPRIKFKSNATGEDISLQKSNVAGGGLKVLNTGAGSIIAQLLNSGSAQLQAPTITTNGALVISTAATVALVGISNISLNTSGQVTFGVPLSSFTETASLSGTFTNTTIGPCIASSTGSLILPTGCSGVIEGWVRCTVSVNSLAATIVSGIVVDGGFADGETVSRGLSSPQEAVSTDGTNITAPFILSGLSCAQHTVCYSPFVSAGTGTIDSTSSACRVFMKALP